MLRAGGADKILHFGAKTTKQIEVRLSFAGEINFQYHLVLSPTNDDGLYASNDAGTYWGSGEDSVLSYLKGWRTYHLHDTSSSSPLHKTAKLDDNQFLRPDGSNLPAFLYYLQEKHHAAYELIRRTVQQVAPFFENFRLAPLRLRPDDIKLEWRHKRSDQYFDSSSFSDGTLRFIALATLFLQPKDLLPPMLLVDEPELGLHPYAIEVLASLIRQASKTTQVIVSTQSSLLLDHFDPEDVLVTNRVNGASEMQRLAPEPLKEWLKDYSLGQLWEKNEIAARPVPE